MGLQKPKRPAIEPFRGAHQGGIATAQQGFTYFAALDIAAKGASEVADLMRAWSAAAARITDREPSEPSRTDLGLPQAGAWPKAIVIMPCTGVGAHAASGSSVTVTRRSQFE